MKKLRNEKGVITMLTLMTVLFMISFLATSYIVIANKVKIQKELLSQMKAIYEPKFTMEEIYNSYLNNDEVICIDSAEQIMKIGKGESVKIGDKYYVFSDSARYVIMQDIEINEDNNNSLEDWIAPEFFFMNKTGTIDYQGHILTVNCQDGTEKIYDGNPVLTLDIAEGTIEIKSDGYKQGNNALVEYTGKYIITGTTTTNTVKIMDRGDFDITLKDLNIDVSSVNLMCAFNANYNSNQTGTNVIIKLEGENVLKGGGAPGLGFAGALANVEGETAGSSLTIEGEGALNATGANFSAGIGGGYSTISAAQGDANNIIINSGTIVATTGNSACGIGSAWNRGANNIVINGGNIIASSGNRAGIGTNPAGNAKYDNQYIIINGGNITTYGREYGESLDAENIIINGGVVNAIAKVKTRAAIRGEGLIINGGTIIATANSENINPGIGLPKGGNQIPTQEEIASVNVKINGGSVISTGSYPIGVRNGRSFSQ